MNTFGKTTWILAMSSMILAPAVGSMNIYLGAAPILLWYAGIPITKNTSMVEIVLNVYDKNNTLVGTYKGLSTDRVSANMYTNKAMAVPSMTNKTFSKAISQIREQMIVDIDKFNSN